MCCRYLHRYSLTYIPAYYAPAYTLDIYVNKSTCTLKSKVYMIKDDKKNHNFACTGHGEVVMRCYVSMYLFNKVTFDAL